MLQKLFFLFFLILIIPFELKGQNKPNFHFPEIVFNATEINLEEKQNLKNKFSSLLISKVNELWKSEEDISFNESNVTFISKLSITNKIDNEILNKDVILFEICVSNGISNNCSYMIFKEIVGFKKSLNSSDPFFYQFLENFIKSSNKKFQSN